ncbi:MAG TPA: cupin domain-containing protein [Blastocatellia bacterium]
MIIVNRSTAAAINTPHGSRITPLIDRTTSQINKCSLAEEILPAGCAVAPHRHRETEEVYYILEGSGTMMVGEESRPVSGGDAIYIPIGMSHTLHNTGTEPLRLLLVCGPAYSYDDHIVE